MTQRDPFSTFGRRFDAAAFRAARIRAGLTVQQAALNIYHSRKSFMERLQLIEDGQRIPALSTVKRACALFGCTIDTLAPRIPDAIR